MQCDIWWSLDWGKQGLNPTLHCNTSINDKSAKSKRKNSWAYINSKKQPNRKKSLEFITKAFLLMFFINV